MNSIIKQVNEETYSFVYSAIITIINTIWYVSIQIDRTRAHLPSQYIFVSQNFLEKLAQH